VPDVGEAALRAVQGVDLRVLLVGTRDDGVRLGDLAQPTSQPDLLVRVQRVLTGQEQHLVLGERGADLPHLRVAELGEVDVVDPGAERRPQRFEVQARRGRRGGGQQQGRGRRGNRRGDGHQELP